MPTKSAKLSPDTVFFHTPEGLVPVHPLDEAPDIEAEEPAWAEDQPPVVLKADHETAFSGEMKIDPKVSKAFTVLGEACRQTADALCCLVRAAVDCLVAIASDTDVAQLLKKAKVHAALNEAPTRVRHLALHGKKHRTRKKNINRALREYQRRH